ncbi:hypothetical protein SAMN03159444_01434 [Pseudomonas sp. NFACC02]|uniref:hypothetical protein n=1 Tax=Pseudomonas sp. NFACC02 TaxID=1566250 RepID=UPI0008B9D5FC|nr:hypothetical protein [Pseudomonas sp. NFACC02]SEQ29353.1 hypothetical protein SAMN03159444_01434 [Pseudomonas sp. NFACC02]
MSTTPVNVDETLSQIKKALENWYRCFILWAVAHYVLGVSSTICAVIAASNINIATKDILVVYVAVATAVLTFLKAQQKNNAYIIAWRSLNSKRIDYFAGKASLDELTQCYKEGEDMIGKFD